MPKFKNNTSQTIEHFCWLQPPDSEAQRILVRFKPGEERELNFWLPWQRLGLMKTSDLPRVPDTILIGEACEMKVNESRRYQVEYCDTYVLDVTVLSGKIELYPGEGSRPALLEQNGKTHFFYHAIYDWEHAPEIIVKAKTAADVSIHAEIAREKPWH